MMIELSKAETIEGEKFTLRRMINPITVGAENLMSFVVTVDPNGHIPEHKHGPAEVALHFLEGKACVTVDRQEQDVQPQAAVYVAQGASIGLKNTGEEQLKFIAVLSPPIDVTVCAVCGIEAKPLQP